MDGGRENPMEIGAQGTITWLSGTSVIIPSWKTLGAEQDIILIQDLTQIKCYKQSCCKVTAQEGSGDQQWTISC
jgi:hypothetical protein